jgi:bifunctional UDP-N-acetylglucosamine pyrophosphorylase/glucosamine-1-phosphate N-acetyltransferase
MLPIANKPILEWNLLKAIDAGIEDFIFVVGYKSEMVRNYFGNGEKWRIKIQYINQGDAQGTAHAIGMVEKFVDDFIVFCGDTIFGKNDIKNIIEKKNSIGLFKVDNPDSYGIVEINNKKVVKIYEKMQDPFTDVINAGIYHFNKKIFEYIKKTGKSPRGEYEITDSINMMIKTKQMNAVFLKEWMDVVYPWDLLDANEDILGKINKKIEGNVEKNTTINRKVIIGKNTIVMAGSYIEGPVIIGDNCRIGPNCFIRPYTSIGNRCHVGNACEVKNTIIMNNSGTPHQNYIGDSIIGENCNFGAGSKVANLRFDKKPISVVLNGNKLDSKRKKLGVIIGDNVQVGINSTINVGTIIGDKCFIGPGAVVKGEIKSNSRIM